MFFKPLTPEKRPLPRDFSSKFNDTVVVPTCGATKGAFIVEEVISEMSPASLLPNNMSMTFEDHYWMKYGVR